MPRSKDEWCSAEEKEVPMETVTELNLYSQQMETRVCLPMSAGELGSDENLSPQKFTYISNESPRSKKKNAEGTIPCLFLDRQMKKEERDNQWNRSPDAGEKADVMSVQNNHDFEKLSHQSTTNDALSELIVTRGNNYYRNNIREEGPGKIMLYFHANAEDLGMCYYMLDCLRERLGVRILAMEYPGYGLHGYESKDTKRLQ